MPEHDISWSYQLSINSQIPFIEIWQSRKFSWIRLFLYCFYCFKCPQCSVVITVYSDRKVQVSIDNESHLFASRQSGQCNVVFRKFRSKSQLITSRLCIWYAAIEEMTSSFEIQKLGTISSFYDKKIILCR